MSEHETKNTPSGETSVMMVEQSTTAQHKHKHSDMDETGELNHKRSSRVPAVACVVEEHNDGRVECDTAPSEIKTSNAAKILPTNEKTRSMSPETVMMVEFNKMGTASHHPVPPPIPSTSNLVAEKTTAEKEPSTDDVENDDDSIKEDIAELQTPAAARENTEWSDDEEAGGLPRSESRASRVSRGVRQLFCCGFAYEAPSEDDLIDIPRFPGI